MDRLGPRAGHRDISAFVRWQGDSVGEARVLRALKRLFPAEAAARLGRALDRRALFAVCVAVTLHLVLHLVYIGFTVVVFFAGLRGAGILRRTADTAGIPTVT